MYIKMKCMGFSCFHRWNFKAALLQRAKHIVKFMCVCMLLAVPLKEKGGKKWNGIFSVRSNNLKKIISLAFELFKVCKQMYSNQSASATGRYAQTWVK